MQFMLMINYLRKSKGKNMLYVGYRLTCMSMITDQVVQ